MKLNPQAADDASRVILGIQQILTSSKSWSQTYFMADEWGDQTDSFEDASSFSLVAALFHAAKHLEFTNALEVLSIFKHVGRHPDLFISSWEMTATFQDIRDLLDNSLIFTSSIEGA